MTKNKTKVTKTSNHKVAQTIIQSLYLNISKDPYSSMCTDQQYNAYQ